jgi:8-oxo-dGTP pyrophosphatase MutT (NUDIX family)
VDEQEVELPNGQTIEGYLLTPFPEVSMVFAVTSDKHILFVEQYKHGAGTTMWDLPAGYVDEDEDPFSCARRELEEETGYLADDWRDLGGWLIDPNRAHACLYYYLALDARPDGRRHLDITEDIAVHRVPLTDVQAVLADGRVKSLATWAGIWAGLAALERKDLPARRNDSIAWAASL